VTGPVVSRSTTRIVADDLDGARVDRAVATLLGIGTASARRLCAARRVFVDERRTAAGDRVRKGQRLRVDDVAAVDDATLWFAPASPVPVLFVDEDLIVVDKPAGMPCHPLLPGEGGTVVDAVVGAFPEVARAGAVAREGGLLHRLDNDTSGCLAFARSRAAFDRLSPALRDGEAATAKTYLAIVHGVVDGGFVIDRPIDHDPALPARMRVVEVGGRAAQTVVKARGSADGHSLVELTLVGGRRHQLRVHLAAHGHPLVGDALYGASSSSSSSSSFLLHAWRLGLPGRPVVQAPLPVDFCAALARLSLAAPNP
jgi:23S rRNA pseudouridine1911/1915/1917 synthase